MNLDKTYIDFIKELKQKIQRAKNRTILSVNRAMIELYFEIGKNIVNKQESLGWGKSVVEQMAKDLQEEFGKRSGYSSANLWRMRIFYLTYRYDSNLAQAVREVPWGHNMLSKQSPIGRVALIPTSIYISNKFYRSIKALNANIFCLYELFLYTNLRRDEDNPTYGCLSLSARFYFMQILFNGALKTAPYDFFNPTNPSTLSEKKT